MPRVPLLLLPGTFCTEAMWRHQRRHLTDVAEVSVGDVGTGESVAEVAESILGRAPERFALAGFSMGAIVAFEILRRAPERVLRLALLDANPGGSTPAQREAWEGMKETIRAGGLEGILEPMTQNVHPARRDDLWLVETIRLMGLVTGERACLRQLSTLQSRQSSRDDLSRISCPTLLIVGRQDEVTPVKLHEEMQAAIPKASLAIVEDSGHYTPMERPQAVTALLRGWLGSDFRQ